MGPSNYKSSRSLNGEIRKYPCGYSQIKNKPCFINATVLDWQSSSNFDQVAANMWLLAQVLSLTLSKFVPTDSQHWEWFSSLLEIIGTAFSACISLKTVLYLKRAIENYLNLFKNVFVDAPIIPKLHFLVHIQNQILKFSPLIRSWCVCILRWSMHILKNWPRR